MGVRKAFASLLAFASICACTGDFDTNRATPKRGTLGREMYTLVCDRVGAQALREDVTGASFHAVCHADGDGNFQNEVDKEKLPSLDPDARDVAGKPVAIETQEKNRAHRIARVEALARRRDDLIAAFDLAFTNEPVGSKDLDNPDPKRSCDPKPGATSDTDIHVELGDTIGRMTELYNDDTIPHLTRSLAHVMDRVHASPEAQAALARFDARRGYRPTSVAMGVSRPTLSYPGLVEMANALLRLLAEGGSAHDSLAQLMAVAHEELRTSKELPALPPLVVTNGRLSRPRGNLELARSILLQQDPAFSIGEPRYVVTRDVRGVAKVTLTDGKLPAPFTDVVGPGGKPDGLADVDDLGQFVTTGAPAPQPFKDFYGEGTPTQRDATGRANVFDYIDVSSTYLASLSKDLVPLLEADPTRQHETLMDLLSGFVVVAGARDEGPKSERLYDGGVRVPYRAFRDDDSPVLDLVHAVGQVFADPTTDDTLALLQKLAADKPDVLARMIGMGLAVKAVADKHPEASLPEKSTLWDEMLDTAVLISQKPALIEDIIRAFGDDATPDMAKSAVAYMSFRDHVSYDRSNLNGPPMNFTTNKVENIKTPVDRTKPDSGTNRSAFQLFLAALHDTKNMSVCTKEGAVAHVKWNGVAIDFPSTAAQVACVFLGADPPPDPNPLCGMFRIKNISHDLVDAVLGSVQLDVRDDCLKKMMNSPVTGIVGGSDAFLEEISGIKGFNTKPSVQAVSRLVYFDLPYDPGHVGDTQNDLTKNFLKDLFDIVPSTSCPPLNFTDTDGAKLNLHQCSTFEGTIRDRDPDALFPLEQFGFLEASKPLARAFQKSDANLLFVELFDILHRHWGSPAQTKKECNPGAPKTDPLWCSQDGGVSYEPLLAEALAGDLFPALHDSVKELSTITIDHCDTRDTKGVCTHTTPWDGVKVMAEAVKAMVDPARNKGLVQRNGDQSVVRNDGTKNEQVTPIYLLIDALKGFDRRMADWKAANPADDRLPKWRRARSQLVDQLFSVDGTGKASKMHNPAFTKMMPVLASTLREQIAANCPDATKSCTWGRVDLAKKMKDVVTGPTFAATMDLLDAIVKDDAARGELERLLQFLLQSGVADAQKAMLASLVDVMQIFEDDGNMTALLHALADAAEPEIRGPYDQVYSRGMILAGVEALSRIFGEVHDVDGTRLCSKEIDPNRTFAVVLRRLVTPPPDGGAPPIEVLIDVAADVNRFDPSKTTKLEPIDYASIAGEVSDFCLNPSRGLEQVYVVIKQATKDL